jgi:hypothetical protein
MKFVLLVILGTIGFSASAQWYRIDLKFKKKREPFALIEQASDHSIARLPVAKLTKAPKIHIINLDRSEYSLEAAENIVMRTAQHNMRFRIYNDASYNFSELARLYIQQNRLSEAKWYLLQSNIISRGENDDKHTVSNLMDLAMIKANIGDYNQAQQDLTEAHDIASIKGFKDELREIEKKMLYIKQNKLSTPKTDLRYAEFPQNTGKGE